MLISRVALKFITSEKLWPRIVHLSITLHRLVVETLVRVAHLDTEGPAQASPTCTVFSHSLEPVTSTLGKQKVVYDTCFLSKMRESTFLNAKEKYPYLLDLQSVTAAK